MARRQDDQQNDKMTNKMARRPTKWNDLKQNKPKFYDPKQNKNA